MESVAVSVILETEAQASEVISINTLFGACTHYCCSVETQALLPLHSRNSFEI